MKQIPLAGGLPNAHQTFSVVLGESELDFELDYLAYIDVPSWNLSIKKDEEYIIQGLLLKVGADLLDGYHLGIGRLFLIGDEPTLENLGITNQLIWIAEDEKI